MAKRLLAFLETARKAIAPLIQLVAIGLFAEADQANESTSYDFSSGRGIESTTALSGKRSCSF